VSKTLVIVESPNKAKKLAAFLGRDYVVKASFGHVADLPAKDYGVDLATLEESYVVRDAKVVKQLREAIAGGGFDRVLLASDPDREGEAIAWHLARQLKVGGRGQRDAVRIEFREITAAAIRTAVSRPRPIDAARVDAQRSRRVLDRIVGFDCSKEICWPAGAQSAGRCQTPALHILCEREREILAFVARTYWTLEAAYAEGLVAFVPAEPKADDRRARRAGGGRRGGRDAGRERKGRLVPRQFATREEAEQLLATARAHAHVVRDVQARRTERRPPPPYTTSTLQQDASRKLRMSAKQAMDAAQALFEAGLITYHRTDSVRVSDEAVEMARAFIAAHHPEALPAHAPRARGTAGAQDAHEAVRPTALDGGESPPAQAARLYAMIRARFLASQASPPWSTAPWCGSTAARSRGWPRGRCCASRGSSCSGGRTRGRRTSSCRRSAPGRCSPPTTCACSRRRPRRRRATTRAG
jgi:DNA topoisomerase-1